MKKSKNFIIIFLTCVIIITICVLCYKFNNWTFRFKSELDQFFGKGNWECISDETKESIIYTKTIPVRNTPSLSSEVPGKYTNWNIKFTNKHGNEEIWKITNHTLKINQDKYNIFSSKRYTNKQALILELMEISCSLAAEEISNDIIKKDLPENIANCIRVNISYKGGNPKPNFYNELFKMSWFNINDISAQNFLDCELYDFYIDIHAFDYKVQKLTDTEQQLLFNNLNNIERRLLDKYGENISFEIYLNSEHKLEYVDGKIKN